MTDLTTRLEKVIPGGAHTYSRGWDQFPANAPKILARGKGAFVFDERNKKFLDFGMGLRSVLLGYADSRVSLAAYKAIRAGMNLTRPTFYELHAAERITNLLPAVEMVKFTKNGSTAVTAAVKLARGYTGRQKILICRQHPFFSFDDWFIGTTEMKKGVSKSVFSDFELFDYSDLAGVENLLAHRGGEFAAILLEPATTVGPTEGANQFEPSAVNYLTKLHDLAKKYGVLLILDEMITGFRYHLKGAQHLFNVKPDLTTFGKALANGFPLAFVGGRAEIMSQGSINTPGSERLFLLSTTHGPEMASLAAMLETVRILEVTDALDKVKNFGRNLIYDANKIAESAGLEKYLNFFGHPSSPNYVTKDWAGEDSLEMRSLFQQELLKERVIMPWVALSAKHGRRELNATLRAIERAVGVLKIALERGSVQGLLEGPPIKKVFRKYN